MSLMVTAYLLEKYGPVLTVPELADVLKLNEGTIRNKLSAKEIDIKVMKQGARTTFHAEDVAAYVDGLRGGAG